MVLFDYDGCGEIGIDSEALEFQVEELLARNGWSDRCGVIVISPELERWIWTPSVEIPKILGMECSYTEILKRVQDAGYILDVDNKPFKPKEAFQLLLKQVRIPLSSSIYSSLASRVSLKRCTDRSFLKFTRLLQEWFPLT